MAARARKPNDVPQLSLVPPLTDGKTPPDAPSEAPAETSTIEPNTFAVDEVEMEIRHLMHVGDKELVAGKLYADAVEKTGAARPSPVEAADACDKIQKLGPPPADYRYPSPAEVRTPEEQVVHPPDEAYAPTSHPEKETTAPVYTSQPRYQIIGQEEIEHRFVLSDGERAVFALTLARQVQGGRDMKMRHAMLRKNMKEEMEAWNGEHARVAEIVETGVEVRTIAVEKEADYRDGVVRKRMKDSGEYLPGTEAISDKDSQLALFARSKAAGSALDQALNPGAASQDLPPFHEPGDLGPENEEEEGEPLDEEEELEEDEEEDAEE